MEAVRPFRVTALDAVSFLSLWLRKPRSIGAVAPSSDRLADAIADQVAFDRPGVVVELGGGTGSITRALLARATNPADIVVIEREPSLCTRLLDRFPGVRVICGNARDLRKLLAEAGIGPVKTVVSGLPLLSLSRVTGRRIIEESFAVLGEEGVFVQFTYGLLSPVRSLHARREGIVGRRTGWVMRNLPPATLWCYRRARQTKLIDEPMIVHCGVE